MQNQQTKKFIQQLIKAKGYDRLSESVQEELELDLREKLDQSISLALISQLSEEQAGKCIALVKKDDKKAVRKLIDDNIDNQEAVIAKALIIFRQAYLHGSERTRARGVA